MGFHLLHFLFYVTLSSSTLFAANAQSSFRCTLCEDGVSPEAPDTVLPEISLTILTIAGIDEDTLGALSGDVTCAQANALVPIFIGDEATCGIMEQSALPRLCGCPELAEDEACTLCEGDSSLPDPNFTTGILGATNNQTCEAFGFLYDNFPGSCSGIQSTVGRYCGCADPPQLFCPLCGDGMEIPDITRLRSPSDPFDSFACGFAEVEAQESDEACQVNRDSFAERCCAESEPPFAAPTFEPGTYPECSICGGTVTADGETDMEISNEEAMVNLDSYGVEPVTCGELEDLARSGALPETDCSLGTTLFSVCQCAAKQEEPMPSAAPGGGATTPSPTASPTTATSAAARFFGDISVLLVVSVLFCSL